jgi:ribonucleoside-diphosphate reductase alpha chain
MSIYELVKSEARLFKYGSGTGTNFSAIRGKQEKLSGGGTSSGLMSFLEVFDRAAGATKSGAAPRAAPRRWSASTWTTRRSSTSSSGRCARRRRRSAHRRRATPSDFNGEAYHTVSGPELEQLDPRDRRVHEGRPRAAARGRRARAPRARSCETYDAKDLWRQVAEAAWGCADPGVQYDTTINRWHTCPNTGASTRRTRAPSTCSSTTRPATSPRASTSRSSSARTARQFDVDGYRHACACSSSRRRSSSIFSSYPTKTIAKNSHDYRPLGLGYANLGTLLMLLGGCRTTRDEGRAIAARITAIMCGHAYASRPRWPATKGPFDGFAKNREPMLRVMGMHRDAAYAIDRDSAPRSLWRAPARTGTRPCARQQHGYRNAQATVLAPTGTIGLLMDCDTTGIEPDFALVKFKKLAGGGYFKIVNQSVPERCASSATTRSEVQEIVAYVSGTNTLLGAPHVNRAHLKKERA